MSDQEKTQPVGQGRPAATSLYGDELRPGAIVGDYAILSTLAAGGGGRVYLAEHRLLGRRGAVKVLHAELATSAEMVERFIREAKTVNRIAHPNIVDIYQLGQLDDGRPFYVMEYVDGADLAMLIRRRGRFSVHEVVEIMEPVCAAVHAAHAAGVIHRDLKSSNVMVGERDGVRVVKLHDFGIAKLIESETGAVSLTALGRRLGTPHAMAPEQLRAEPVDARTDVYALGVLLFQLLTGRYPFDAEDPAALEKMHLEAPPPRPSQLAPISPDLEAVVLRCLEKRPADRYATAPDLLAALRAALHADEGRGARGRALVPAVGIHVECRMDLGADEDLDEDLLDRMAEALDHAQQDLDEAGCDVVLHIGGALLGVTLVPPPRPIAPVVQGAVAAAGRVRGELARRLAAARLAILVTVHVDRVIVGDGRPSGGPLLHLATWAPRQPPADVLVTPAARAALGDQP